MKGNNLLFINEVFNLKDTSILENWPVADGKNFLKDIKLLLEESESLDPAKFVEGFFDDFEKSVTERISICKKSVLSDIE